MAEGNAILIIFAGLPGVGKTAVARELGQIGATYLRIDSIEQAIRSSPAGSQTGAEAGYRVAYALAGDNLRLGRKVVADSVNPLRLTRNAWVELANAAGARAAKVEVRCSDTKEHRRRVETRIADISGLRLPTWDEVVSREYHPWDRDPFVLDTAGQTVAQATRKVREMLRIE
jgi:predicted kinase